MTEYCVTTYCKPNRYLAAALVVLFCVGGCQFSWAQLNSLSVIPEKKETRNGNKQYEKAVYTDAEASYKKALDKKNNMPEATFNLGDAVYEQKRYEEAIKQFQLSAQTNPDKGVKAKAYHNLGNTYMQQYKWQEAVNAYKEALKNNPADTDTKYNLAYANNRLREQQKKDGENKDNKDQKDKKDDKKDQNKDQQKKDQNKQDQNNDQQAQNKENQDKKDQQSKQQPQPKLSKEEAEKMLQALQGEEQKTNQKMQQKQVKLVKVKIDKDW